MGCLLDLLAGPQEEPVPSGSAVQRRIRLITFRVASGQPMVSSAGFGGC